MQLGGTTVHGATKHDTTVAAIASGQYEGNGTQNRAIPHGLGQTPKMVLISHEEAAMALVYVFSNGSTMGSSDTGHLYYTAAAMDSTNFYVGNATGAYTNDSGYTVDWVAIV